ncbi:tetratricopeptide repeat protein [Desulfobacula sp.]|uniref:tetratricopeptide repeat protein n=1 Tax=Desulfobacula sp. TaxID=2593537 RepID=UPI00262CC89C|nr:tetratricopeptide repeat protein [Desulfobacula sp.]
MIYFVMGVCLFGCTNQQNEGMDALVEKGDMAFARRDHVTAANHFNIAYLKIPGDISLIDKLGACYLKTGRLERAKVFYKKAIEIDPDHIDIQIKLAQLHILTGKLSEAQKICDLFDKKKPIHPELDLIRADLSLMTHQLDRAENFYRKAVLDSKESLRPLMKLAIFLKSVGKHAEAAGILKIVKKNTIVSVQLSLLMADYYLLDNGYDQAEKFILDAIESEPEDNSLKYHLVQFYLASENNAKAETVLETVLENQNDIYLRMMLSDVYILNGKLEKAEQMILKLKKEIKEPIIEFELLQGKFWLYTGKSIYASAYLESALDLNPGLGNAQYLLGLTHLINGNIKLSENSLIRTLQIYPNHYKALLLISELLYKKKEYHLSLTYLDRLLEKYPEDFTGHLIKGLNLLGQQKYSLAKKEFNVSVHLSQRLYIPYYYLGLTEEFMGNGMAALTYYEQVLGSYPDLTDVAYRYCLLLIKTK